MGAKCVITASPDMAHFVIWAGSFRDIFDRLAYNGPEHEGCFLYSGDFPSKRKRLLRVPTQLPYLAFFPVFISLHIPVSF